MNILISNSGEKPIYEQITSQIKNLIIQGELAAGQALPSMRLLAKELRISVITTKRAYEELEREGFVQTVPGKGSFVASKNTELIREEQYRPPSGRAGRTAAGALSRRIAPGKGRNHVGKRFGTKGPYKGLRLL